MNCVICAEDRMKRLVDWLDFLHDLGSAQDSFIAVISIFNKRTVIVKSTLVLIDNKFKKTLAIANRFIRPQSHLLPI